MLGRAIRDISAALATKELRPVVSQRLPLGAFVQADRIVAKLSGLGNLVLIPGP